MVAVFLAAFWASSYFRGALVPVFFLAVCLVLAMLMIVKVGCSLVAVVDYCSSDL